VCKKAFYPFERLVVFPEHVSELPEGIRNHAFSEPPVETVFERYAQILSHIPLRESSSLLKNERERQGVGARQPVHPAAAGPSWSDIAALIAGRTPAALLDLQADHGSVDAGVPNVIMMSRGAPRRAASLAAGQPLGSEPRSPFAARVLPALPPTPTAAATVEGGELQRRLSASLPAPGEQPARVEGALGAMAAADAARPGGTHVPVADGAVGTMAVTRGVATEAGAAAGAAAVAAGVDVTVGGSATAGVDATAGGSASAGGPGPQQTAEAYEQCCFDNLIAKRKAIAEKKVADKRKANGASGDVVDAGDTKKKNGKGGDSDADTVEVPKQIKNQVKSYASKAFDADKYPTTLKFQWHVYHHFHKAGADKGWDKALLKAACRHAFQAAAAHFAAHFKAKPAGKGKPKKK